MKYKKLKEIEHRLGTHTIGSKIIYFESIGSTNDYAKEQADNLENGTIILSEEQEAGKGRMGRDWSSPKGRGIWMSVILKPKILITEASKITQIAAAAVCISIRELTNLEALVKWPNDIVINSKKVSGILIEASLELNKINYLVVGIGVNTNNISFSKELKEKATSLFIEGHKEVDRKDLIVKIIENFEKLYDEYIDNLNLEKTLYLVRKYSAIIGKEINIIQGKSIRKARVINIDSEGLLLVQAEDGSMEIISSGEVSIRGKKGYASFE